MMFAPGGWRPGRARAWLADIPEADRCTTCRGSGESMTKHQFIGGYSHMPCHNCGGSGRKADMAIPDDPPKEKPPVDHSLEARKRG